MSILLEIGAVLIALFLLYILYRIVKQLMIIVANSVIGLVIFFLLNLGFGLGIPINIWSLLITGIAGIPGVILILILHFLGLGF